MPHDIYLFLKQRQKICLISSIKIRMTRFEGYITIKVKTQRDHSLDKKIPKYFTMTITQMFASAWSTKPHWWAKRPFLWNTHIPFVPNCPTDKHLQKIICLPICTWLPVASIPLVSNRWKGGPGACLRLHPKPTVNHVQNPNRVATFEHKVHCKFRFPFTQLAKTNSLASPFEIICPPFRLCFEDWVI